MPTQSFLTSKTFVRGPTFVMLSLLLSNCAKAESASGPTAEELREIASPHYKTAPEQTRECLGRLVFDVNENVEFAVPPYHTSRVFGMGSSELTLGKRSVWAAGVTIDVNEPVPKTKLEELARSHKKRVQRLISKRQRDLVQAQRIIKKLLNALQQPDYHDPKGLQHSIEGYRADIQKYEQAIKKHEASLTYKGFDLGLPDSLGWNHIAYLWRNQRLYTITLNLKKESRSKEQLQAALITAANNFRVRDLFEIPDEIGICFPYGFIKDTGTEYFHVRSIFRYKDRPSVAFIMLTEIVTDFGAEPTVFNAAARAIPKSSIFREYEKKIARRVGPHSVKIGPLNAQQGGFGVNVEGSDGPTETYDVYTGYAGYEDSQVLPTITVNMLSTTQEKSPILKSDPPPFDESYSRLTTLLNSINLRPTEKTMPELKRI